MGWVPHRASCSAAHLPSLAVPPYHPNTPTCLWKTVIEWVYVVKLINHINLYLLVGWLKAMTIRLMKLVNSSYPHHTPNYNEPQKKEKKSTERETVMTKLAIKIWLLIECLLLLMMRFIKRPWERNINWLIKVLQIKGGVYKAEVWKFPSHFIVKNAAVSFTCLINCLLTPDYKAVV